ncbi:MDR family MFS transporter [Paenibacillus nasutitermitis]|uniref:MFS-type transporter YusP n=1 Tax=Paenibacillus nasutitermitis TaxID=1652958 RepID=A0A916Z737_9BACL|nr:MDR family MFS transporter [Paenibacillus nasutitermitis]GGD77610.1 putative MFS-type transporter YusP [Paenibacillus nasutitermitis]
MEHLTGKQKVTIMIAIMAAMFFAAINQTIVSTAMPRIAALLNGMDHYTWVVTIYMLTSTISTVLVGKLSDIYGRKPFLMVGIVLFMVGAFLCGTSVNITQMITYRGLQGVGGGIIMATAITAVGDLFAPRERAKWTGLLMAIFGFSSVIGPTLGGWMVDHMDWEWIFWIFLPIGIVAFVLIMLLFPKSVRKYNESIDYWGSLFLTLTIVPLLLGFSWAGTKYDWGSPQTIGLFAASLVSLIIFILIERVVKSPVLPLSLFRNSVVTISSVAGFLMNAGMLGALIYLPFFVQGVEGISPTYSGYVTMPMSISMIILSALTGRWMTKSGKYKRFALIGMLIMTAGMVMMAFMNSIPVAIAIMVFFGMGLGFGMPVFTLAAQNAVKPTELGVVTATSQLFRNMGGTIGIAVMGSIMTSRLANNIKTASASGPDLSSADPEVLKQLAPLQNPQILLDKPQLDQLQASLPTEIQGMVEQLVQMLRDALSSSLTTVFLSGAGLVAIALVLVLFLKELPLRSSAVKPGAELEKKQGTAVAEPS